MSFQRTHNNYRNGSCIHKRSCRYILQGLIDDINPSYLNSVTLPALEFDLERKLLDKYPGTYNLCEINKKVFMNQTKILPEGTYMSSIRHCLGDVLELNTQSPLNFVWLDLCSYLTEELFNKIESFTSINTFRDEGVIGITLMSSRENKQCQKFFKTLQKRELGTNLTTLQNFRKIQLPKIFKKVLEKNINFCCELQANYTYSPSSGGGIMTMYCFKWGGKKVIFT